MLSDLEMYAALHQRRATDLLAAVRTHKLRLHDAYDASRNGITTLEGIWMRRKGKSLDEVRSHEARFGHR